MKTAIVEQAIELVRSGNTEAADDLLAGQWDGEGSWRTKRVCERVRVMGAGFRQDELENLFRERARLLVRAREHHEAGGGTRLRFLLSMPRWRESSWT